MMDYVYIFLNNPKKKSIDPLMFEDIKQDDIKRQ